MVKRRGILIKWSWHDKGTIPVECVAFHNLLGFLGDKGHRVELLIMKVLLASWCPCPTVASRNCLLLTHSWEINGR
jgi:hypothetical protein